MPPVKKDSSPAKAVEVAAFLVELGEHELEVDQVDQLRCQKLLYFIQGWALARLGRPMFEERIEAWVKGPVVPEVRKHTKKFGREKFVAKRSAELSEQDKDFIASVWQDYRQYSNSGLIELTHEPGPWKDARAGLTDDESSRRVIELDALERHFKGLLPQPLTDEELEHFPSGH